MTWPDNVNLKRVYVEGHSNCKYKVTTHYLTNCSTEMVEKSSEEV